MSHDHACGSLHSAGHATTDVADVFNGWDMTGAAVMMYCAGVGHDRAAERCGGPGGAAGGGEQGAAAEAGGRRAGQVHARTPRGFAGVLIHTAVSVGRLHGGWHMHRELHCKQEGAL
jgi:hypothetical protein